MEAATMVQLEARLRRVERQNRVLIVLLCAMAAVASIAATRAASNVVVADEVRARRFTLLDPRGGVADDWYAADPSEPNVSRNMFRPYSGWWYHAP